MKRRDSRNIGAILRDGTAVDRAIVMAGREVIERHRQLGLPLVNWRDGQVVEVSPWSLELPVYQEGSSD